MLVKEGLNFERGMDPKIAMGIGNQNELIRQKHIAQAKIELNKPQENGMFKPDYIISRDSTKEEIYQFIADCKNLKKDLSRGVISLLIKGLENGFVTVIECKKPKYGNGSVPKNYFYWRTVENGIYDPGDIFVMADDIKNYDPIVREGLNFERGRDPKFSMGVGTKSQILKDLEDEGIDEKNVEINPDFTITWIGSGQKPSSLKYIQIKYLPENKKKFVKDLSSVILMPALEKIIDEAIKNGVSPNDCWELLVEYNTRLNKREIDKANLYIKKIGRDQEQIEYEEEYNTYAFIGFTDNEPVEIDGETYYKKKFGTEPLIKIDKYNYEHLMAVSAMKTRASFQYQDGRVYLLDVPNFIMDEERYEKVPPHAYDLLVKYKRRA